MLWDCSGRNADTWNVDGRIIALFMEEISKLILRDLDQANNNSNRMDEYYPFDQAGELCFFIDYYSPAVVMARVTCSKCVDIWVQARRIIQ